MHFSPDNRHPAIHILGNQTSIEDYGTHLVGLGTTMDDTADALQAISDGESQIAESVDKLRESAGEVVSDLRKAATRYTETGEVLKSYASALSTAQILVDSVVDEIDEKHTQLTSAREDQSDAQSTVNGQRHTMPWEDEPTDAERSTADSALSTANGQVSTLEGELDALWVTFERRFGNFSRAYDNAVSGIEQAFETAGNNDGWFNDLLDGFLTFLSYVAIALTVAALFVTGPLAAIILAALLIISVVSLIGHIYLMTQGRASWTDLLLDVVGIIPFVRPIAGALRGGGGLFRAAGRFMNSARVSTAANTVGNSARRHIYNQIRRSGPADDVAARISQLVSVPRPSGLAGAWSSVRNFGNSIRYGHRETGRALDFMNHMRLTAPDAGVRNLSRWVTNNMPRVQVPSGLQQVANSGGFAAVFDQPARDLIPAYDNVRSDY